jgi:predicted regulator of Ras-like GTPase activity (Roadblock/LC7/MglB family)
MNIPFLDLWTKAKERFLAATTQVPASPNRIVPVEKPSGERLSKTVLPNMTRNFAPADPFQAAASASGGRTPATTRGRATGTGRLPPVVAFALTPKVERAISLPLSDVLAQVPEGYVKSPEMFDGSRSVLLKASELEKGMAKGQPTVSLASVYEQVPEIFLRSIPSGDSTQLPLPFDKVMAQFTGARVRTDQEHDQSVPQVETPFLQVTIEDTQQFGTTMEPLQASAHPPVKMEPASARSFAAAEPESAVRETSHPHARSTIPLSELGIETPPPPQKKDAGGPVRIPFNLPPNGTGASASERVPASSGPPVPTRSSKKAVSPPPPAPFKVKAPSDDLRPKLTLVPGMEPAPEPEFAPPPRASRGSKDERKVALALDVVLQNMPAFQLSGSSADIPSDIRIEFPFSLVQPQLATGRVAIPPRIFQAALPLQYRQLFLVDSADTPVLLPLQEVLKNLPTASLQMREDQVEAEAGEAFETPFSIKAKEDAERFKVSAAPISKPEETPAVAAGPEKPVRHSPGEGGIDIDEKIDAKEMVTRVSALPGVAACSITFTDGLILAGNLPTEVAAEGLCAMAPSLLQRIEKHMLDTGLGSLTGLTLHCAKSSLTFFMHGNICLGALHAGGDFPPETQSKLAEMAKRLSRTYAHTEAAHVDH